MLEKKCSHCHPACKTCTGPTVDKCFTCSSGYFFDEATNSCNTYCPNISTYPDGDPANRCTKCVAPCETCRTATVCTACYGGYYLKTES